MNLQEIANMPKTTNSAAAGAHRRMAKSASDERAEKRKRERMSDADVRLLVQMKRDEPQLSLRKLAVMFEVSLTCVAFILKGERRASASGLKPRTRRAW